jgi:hypothetical protein
VGLGGRNGREQKERGQYSRRIGRFGACRPPNQGLRPGHDPILVELAEAKKLDGVVVPVRPSAKVQHPWVPIADYIGWTDEDGRPYDPWLRSHLSVGGKIIGPCERSMVVHEPIAFWENWSRQRFESSGAYPIEGALAPVKIDLDRRTGTYEEPNVWVSYGL